MTDDDITTDLADEPGRTPNPGSETARREGCICAVMDNNNGKWAPYPPDGWWITVGCPVHHHS